MKKRLSLALAAMLFFSALPTAHAANTTVLTTEVPEVQYTLHIPANKTIPFGATEVELGQLTVSDASGFSDSKNLKVNIDFKRLASSSNDTTIYYQIDAYTVSQSSERYGVYPCDQSSGYNKVYFLGKSDGTLYGNFVKEGGKDGDVEKTLYFVNSSSNWKNALPGTYTSTITFTAEVVAGK